MKKILFFGLLLSGLPTFAQGINCDELLSLVEKEGRRRATVASFQLNRASWLKEVVAYTFDDQIAVVATIKNSENDFYGEKYIFCGVPPKGWDYFHLGLYDWDKTYEKRFSKYIMEHRCHCI